MTEETSFATIMLNTTHRGDIPQSVLGAQMRTFVEMEFDGPKIVVSGCDLIEAIGELITPYEVKLAWKDNTPMRALLYSCGSITACDIVFTSCKGHQVTFVESFWYQ